MYVTIRAYQGNAELADALSSREDELKDVIGSIDGFRAYYLVKLAEGTATVSVFDSKEGADARPQRPRRGCRRTCRTWRRRRTSPPAKPS